MITVKLYGLLRLDSGIKSCQLEAQAVTDVYNALAAKGIPEKDLKACVVLVNGKAAQKRNRLQDGDVVQLLSPVAGG